MRSVRRAALVGSLLLTIAAAVGWFVWPAERRHDDDVAARTAAHEMAAELGRVVAVAESTGVAASDPSDAARALRAHVPSTTVRSVWCVADPEFGAELGRDGADGVDGAAAGVECADSDVDANGLAAALAARAGTPETTAIVDVVVMDSEAVLRVVTTRERVLLGVDVRPGDLVDARPGTTFVVARSEDAPGVETVGGLRRAGVLIPGTDAAVVAAVPERATLGGDQWLSLLAMVVASLTLLVVAEMVRRAEQRALVERASIDPLTRLPNRSEFERCAAVTLDEARRTGTGACMLLFDLDGFKFINDTRGHQAGDDVLRTIGRRLRRSVRDSDVVARWGGDEFVLLLPGIEDASAARSRAADLASIIASEPVGEDMHVGASVGIAMFPRHGAELAELVDAADAAMYAAKRDGVTARLAGVESAPLLPGHAVTVERRRSHVVSG